jgi:hypothetical protein
VCGKITENVPNRKKIDSTSGVRRETEGIQ